MKKISISVGRHNSNAPKCSIDERSEWVRRLCKKSHDTFLNGNSNNSARIYIDRGKKLMGCLINKAGTTTWSNYVMNLQAENNPGAKQNLNPKNNADLALFGLSFQKDVPLEYIKTIYRDFDKYIIVRHPLQRLVSGYFQNIRTNEHNITFEEFMHGFADGWEVDRNIHWLRYYTNCHICDIDYHYVLKSETLAQDVTEFNDKVGYNTTVKPLQQNVNFQMFDAQYKYDTVLGEFNRRYPDIFQKVLKIFQPDMDLFGYGWDNEHSKSYCQYPGMDGLCC